MVLDCQVKKLASCCNGIVANVFGLGEVAEPKIQIEVQMFKIKNEC